MPFGEDLITTPASGIAPDVPDQGMQLYALVRQDDSRNTFPYPLVLNTGIVRLVMNGG